MNKTIEQQNERIPSEYVEKSLKLSTLFVPPKCHKRFLLPHNEEPILPAGQVLFATDGNPSPCPGGSVVIFPLHINCVFVISYSHKSVLYP